MNKNLLTAFFLFSSISCCAQPETRKISIPIERQRFHDRIGEEQKLLDMADGSFDGRINISKNQEINAAATDVMLKQITALEESVELNPAIIQSSDKVRYLTCIEKLVRAFRTSPTAAKIKLGWAALLLDNFTSIMQADIAGKSIAQFIISAPYDIGSITTDIFRDNTGYSENRKILYLKLCALEPAKAMRGIGQYANEPFADSLISAICRRDPTQAFTYAQDTQSLTGRLIHHNPDPLVKAIVKLSQMPSGLLYFPFLDDIVSGKRTVEGLKKAIDDEVSGVNNTAYYKLLVEAEIDYHSRAVKADTAVNFSGVNSLKEMLRRKALEHFVGPMNDMHEQSESVRMRPIEGLSSVDIYYMLVMGEDELYTSTYEKSFARMLQRMDKEGAAGLLARIDNDYFRRFIRMAASFNRLEAFFRLMPQAKSESLMKDFVGHLEKSEDLEDAVNVADSYGSISNKALLAEIRQYVEENRQRCIQDSSKRGQVIYKLLNEVFLGANAQAKPGLQDGTDISSVYTLDNKALQNDSGRIVQQVFFYGDGKKIFSDYVNSFSSKDWTVNSSNPEWTEVRSIKKPEILIYANKPLDNNNNLDDSAQAHLSKFLSLHHLLPSIVIHRGHSYWLPGTMDRMPGNAKLVVLGSCGGYKNLSQLIDINPDAHIISTKQIGTGLINYNIISLLNRKLLSGEPIDWRKMWDELNATFSRQPAYIREAWRDYVPPYKNLGAAFLKAYNRSLE